LTGVAIVDADKSVARVVAEVGNKRNDQFAAFARVDEFGAQWLGVLSGQDQRPFWIAAQPSDYLQDVAFGTLMHVMDIKRLVAERAARGSNLFHQPSAEPQDDVRRPR
jgi:hypothetical protein